MVDTPNLIYPRLDTTIARELLHDRRNCTLEELKDLGELSHPSAAPAAVGGTPATEARLEEVQSAVRLCAAEAGFPDRMKQGNEQTFDRPCATALYETMRIVPGDAATTEVWTFMTVVLVPEIAPWRYPNTPEERQLGRPRNTLRRLWWRAWSLGPDLDEAPDGCSPLGEDEFVAIMERTSLSGSQTLARAIRDGIWRAEIAGRREPRSKLMRQLALRVRARRSHIALDTLDPAQLEDLIDEMIDEAAAAIAGD